MVGKGEVRRGNYILHELLADGTNILAEGGAEHHHLLLVGRHAEDLLHITTHICNKASNNNLQSNRIKKTNNFAQIIHNQKGGGESEGERERGGGSRRKRFSLTKVSQHFVALVKNEVLDVLEGEGLCLGQSKQTAWSANNNVGAVLLQNLLILLDRHASKEDSNLHIVGVFAEPLVLLADLEGQLTCVGHHKHRDL